jgi:hypothetical protein
MESALAKLVKSSWIGQMAQTIRVNRELVAARSAGRSRSHVRDREQARLAGNPQKR